MKGWPEGLPLREEFAMRQGYISVRPTVRIREEALTGGRTDYICLLYTSIRPEVSAFMKELDEELWKLGIPAKTKHNEVAPCQRWV